MRKLILSVACVVMVGCSSDATSSTSNDGPDTTEGYGPCIEAARDDAGDITAEAVDRCLDEHM